MPTPGGLPKRGEVWRRTWRLPPDWKPNVVKFVVLERSRGDYWSLRVWIPAGQSFRTGRQHWVDPAAWFRQGELTYVGQAGPETRRKLNLS